MPRNHGGGWRGGGGSGHARHETSLKFISNDLPPVGTPYGGVKDSSTYFELITLCTNLLETVSAQAKEITTLKKMVLKLVQEKKLKKFQLKQKKKTKVTNLRRLKKIGTSQRISSSSSSSSSYSQKDATKKGEKKDQQKDDETGVTVKMQKWVMMVMVMMMWR